MIILNMLINISHLGFILPLVKIEFYNNQYCFFFKTLIFQIILKILKYHFKYNFNLLIFISGVDYPENKNRFKIIYEILSLKFNNRIRLKISVNEITQIYSVKKIFISAVWWEDELWDMFGIVFLKHKNLIRLLTDYGFQGFPLRKDFPLSGFIDLKYNLIKNRISYEKLELSQNYRIFNYNSPWEY